MAENSKIQWTTHTMNPWRGCTRVSPGCAHCYAETMSKRNPKVLGIWGPQGTRVVAAETQWREPLKWNRDAACTCGGGFRGVHSEYCPQANRPRVFCASLADVFEDWHGSLLDARQMRLVRPWLDRESNVWCSVDDETFDKDPQGYLLLTLADVRRRLLDLIGQTPNIDWLLLTKRPENVKAMMPRLPSNAWIGTTVENQASLHRAVTLAGIPAAVRFLSVEPCLGPIDLGLDAWYHPDYVAGKRDRPGSELPGAQQMRDLIHWVIVGGESGHGARPFNLDWARNLRDQCRENGVAFFFKQAGSNPEGGLVRFADSGPTLKLIDRKGGDLSEIPEDLRHREFPQ